MAASDFSTILAGALPPNRSGLLQALEKRAAYVVVPGENPAALTPGFIQVLVYNGLVFWYDSTDATSVHDGVTVIVTADGKRFKTDQARAANARVVPVLDKDLTAPPGGPAIGATYIVAAGGTGAWATKDKYFATWTARGWVFTIPNAFDMAFVRDEVIFYYYSAVGVWTQGLPGLTIGDATISLKKLKYFPLGVAVENQTTNTPPVGPADGVAYIVGGTPTGAWAGQTLKVAIFETAAWVFYTPYEGAQVYDKSLDAFYKHNGATWVAPPVNAWTLIEKRVIAAPIFSADFINLSGYNALRIMIMNLIPTSNQVTCRLRLTSDNGATFINANYGGNVLAGVNPDAVNSRSLASNGFELRPGTNLGSTDNIGNAAGDGGLDANINVTSFNVAQKTKFNALYEFGNDNGVISNQMAIGGHTAQTAMNGFQFVFSSGNIASGTILVEGLA